MTALGCAFSKWMRGCDLACLPLRGGILVYHTIERIAFSIVRVDVRYPGGIVGIVLQYGSSNRIYLCIGTMSFEI